MIMGIFQLEYIALPLNMTIEKPTSQNAVNGKPPSLSRVLPNDFYLTFLSDVAKARKPAPSEYSSSHTRIPCVAEACCQSAV